MNKRQAKKKWKKEVAKHLISVTPIKEKKAELNIIRVYQKGKELNNDL